MPQFEHFTMLGLCKAKCEALRRADDLVLFCVGVPIIFYKLSASDVTLKTLYSQDTLATEDLQISIKIKLIITILLGLDKNIKI